jgi:hypothetical protein
MGYAIIAKVFTSKPFLIILVVAIILAAVYLSGRRKGKEQAYEYVPLPDGGASIPSAWKDGNLKEIVAELADRLDGVLTWDIEKEKSFATLMALTDDQLTAVYNEFNRQFEHKGQGTMTQWIVDEWSVSIVTIRPALVKRLRTLGLS